MHGHDFLKLSIVNVLSCSATKQPPESSLCGF